METTRFLGHDCVELKNESISLLVTQSVGPRIISLRLGDSKNIFAELPTQTLDCPGVGEFHLYGGHRLWHAPEIPHRTYLPDDAPVEITPVENGLQVNQPVEKETGIKKSMCIILPDDSPTVIVEHSLENCGIWPVPCAPWAITQLKPGGVAILPHNTSFSDADGVQPNRSFALWPYTDMNCPQIHWGNDYTLIEANLKNEKLKLGYPNPRGWLGYFWNDLLFVKWADFDAGATYYDHGSSSQCFCGLEFIELETLGPSAQVLPEETISHRETWRVYRDHDFSPEEDSVQALVEKLELE